MLKLKHLYRFGLISGVAAGFVSVQPALAQQAREIEEITVTARKKVENIQDVGISVSAFGQTELEHNFANDIRDLANISPNLVIDDTKQGPGGVASIYIRGVGVSDVEKNFDTAVGVVVDGVFLGTLTGGIARTIDLERVEVLRGPQGTLFGRNTIGGVINLVRTKPTGEFGAKLKVNYGDYDTVGYEGIVNFGLSDTMALKLSLASRDQREGFYTNINTGRDEGRVEYQSYGFNLLFNPVENLELEYTFQNEETDQDTPPIINVGQPGQLFCDAFGFCSPSISTPYSGDRLATAGDLVGPNDASFDTTTHIFEARWDINDNYHVDYILGRWETEEKVLTDFDGLPPELFHTTRPAEYEQTSHELRLSYNSDGPFSWTAGAYLWESDYEIRLRSFIGFAVPDVVLDLPQTSKQETDSWALFFEADYEFNDLWTLTFGGRYSYDEKTTDQAGIVNAAGKDDWNEFTPKLGLKYQMSDDIMLYSTYSVGYRSGGFNGRVDSVETATQSYDQETVDNYEFGFKTEWLNNRLRLNGAIFYMDYKDKQEELQLPSATSGTGQVTKVTNASTADITGLELDLIYYPTEALSIRANLGLLDAEYDKFSFESPTGIVDFSHLDLRRAPDVTAALSATYEWSVAGNDAWARIGYKFLDEHAVDFANKIELNNDSQHLVDASINLEMGNLLISLYGRNLTDEDGYSIGFDVASLWSYSATRDPRTWGVEVTYDFGK